MAARLAVASLLGRDQVLCDLRRGRCAGLRESCPDRRHRADRALGWIAAEQRRSSRVRLCVLDARARELGGLTAGSCTPHTRCRHSRLGGHQDCQDHHVPAAISAHRGHRPGRGARARRPDAPTGACGDAGATGLHRALARQGQGRTSVVVRTAVMVLLHCLVPLALLVGQTTPSTSPARVPWALWGTFAPVGAHTLGGKTAAIAITLQRRQMVYSVRLAGAEGPPCTASDCWPDALDLSGLVGIGSSLGTPVHISAAAGIGAVGFRDDGGVALSGEVQASLWPTRFLGLVLYGFGSTMGPQCGAAFGLQVGRLR
jgi:hypothetical protein